MINIDNDRLRIRKLFVTQRLHFSRLSEWSDRNHEKEFRTHVAIKCLEITFDQTETCLTWCKVFISGWRSCNLERWRGWLSHCATSLRVAGSISRSQWPSGLRPVVCWDCGFEFHRGHKCLCCVCCTIKDKSRSQDNQDKEVQREQKNSR